MRLMLAAERTEFLHLDPFRCRFFIFRFAVVAVLTFTALKLNDFAWHF